MTVSKNYLDKLTYDIIGCCINVHKELGPGLLESVYHTCLRKEFDFKSIKYKSELIVPVTYRGLELDTRLKADFLIEQQIVLEIKAVSELHSIHDAQVLTYMKLLKCPKGILVNFNSLNIFHDGQKTFVNKLFSKLDEYS